MDEVLAPSLKLLISRYFAEAVPFEVDTDNSEADTSYLPIVPFILNVVEAGGPDGSPSVETMGPGPFGDWANDSTPETIAAHITTTESRFFMTRPLCTHSGWNAA